MNFSLSVREKRLLVWLVGLAAFFSWYKVFWDGLWPRYQELQTESLGWAALEQEVAGLKERISGNERLLSQLNGQIKEIHNKLGPDPGLLLSTLENLAEGKVTILKIEPDSSRQAEFFQVHSFRMVCAGPYSKIVPFLQSLEEQTGLSLQTVQLSAPYGDNGMLEVSLLFDLCHVDREVSPSVVPSLIYQSYHDYDPFWAGQATGEEEPGTAEQQLPGESTQEDWQLAPYTFPAR